MERSLPEAKENRNVWRIVNLIGCVAMMSLFGVVGGTTTSHPSPPQIHQTGWRGAMENLNQEVLLLYPQNDATRHVGTDREYADPFQQTFTDVFIPTVSAIERQTQHITLSVVVKAPSGSYMVMVSGISNRKTALYLSLPDQVGRLKTSHVPFCYVWEMRWGPGNRSFSAIIDYTVTDQMTWV